MGSGCITYQASNGCIGILVRFVGALFSIDFLSEKDLRSKLAQREELFLSEISEKLERCSENSELFLNSCSSAEYSRFLLNI